MGDRARLRVRRVRGMFFDSLIFWVGGGGWLSTFTHTLQTRLVALCLSSRATKNSYGILTH